MEDNENTSVSYFDNKANIFRDGPYDFWYIKLERGVTPKELTGAFTSKDTAEIAVKSLEASKKFLKTT